MPGSTAVAAAALSLRAGRREVVRGRMLGYRFAVVLQGTPMRMDRCDGQERVGQALALPGVCTRV